MSSFLTNKTDEELWDLMRQDSKPAFAVLYKRYIQILLSFGKRLSQDKEIIADTIQELFIEFWENRKTLSEVHNVKIYLIKSFRFKLNRNLSSSKKYQSTLTYEDLMDGYTEFEESENTFSQKRKELLKSELGKLPERQREVIHLRYYHNFDNEEIAEIISVNYQSVSNLLYRAIQKIRKNVSTHSRKLPFF